MPIVIKMLGHHAWPAAAAETRVIAMTTAYQAKSRCRVAVSNNDARMLTYPSAALQNICRNRALKSG